MKRKTFAPQLLSLMGLAVSVSSFGQTESYTAINRTSHAPAEAGIAYSAAPATVTVSTALEKGFAKSYPQATDTRWIKLEKGFQASFINAGQKTTAVFDDYGKFSYAISQLGADKIPAEVSDFIRKQYPGYNLLQVIAVRDNSKTVYQTTLQHGSNHVKIKSIGEDLEVSTLENRPNAQ